MPSRTLLSAAGNIEISGGQFIQAEMMNNNFKRAEADIALERLLKRVATTAFHNSAQRVDPPRCHPETREEILKRIYDWIMQSKDREKWLLWLNGAAGAGKSAIMQSTAERCAIAAVAIASFFFFRGDHTRNTIAPFVATLAYQLMRAIPETSDDILQAVERDPLIFDQSLEYQLQQLIIEPLFRLPRELQRLLVVLVDGLDECNDQIQQSNLIKIFGNLSSGRNVPVVFVVASRREPQIEAAFVEKSVSDLLSTLALDNSDIEQTSDDIRRFLTHRFNDIKENHLRRNLIPPNWPPLSIIEDIVAKSSGQFIFASVVINYISSPRKNPIRQLELVRDIRLQEASSQNPFAHLDALYQHIFSQVEDLDMVLDILALAIFAGRRLVAAFEYAFQLASGELIVCLGDLTAIINCDEAEIKFLHASLPDFLLDKSRAGKYYLDSDLYRTKLVCMLLEKTPLILATPSSMHSFEAKSRFAVEQQRLFAIWNLLYYGANDLNPNAIKASDQLCFAFMNFRVTPLYSSQIDFPRWDATAYTEILKFLVCNMDIDDNWRTAYNYILDVFSVGHAARHRSLSFDIAVKSFKAKVNKKAHLWKLHRIYNRQPVISPGSTCGFSCRCLLGTFEDNPLFDTSSGRAAYIYHNPDPNDLSYACGPCDSASKCVGWCRSLYLLPRAGSSWLINELRYLPPYVHTIRTGDVSSESL